MATGPTKGETNCKEEVLDGWFSSGSAQAKTIVENGRIAVNLLIYTLRLVQTWFDPDPTY